MKRLTDADVGQFQHHSKIQLTSFVSVTAGHVPI